MYNTLFSFYNALTKHTDVGVNMKEKIIEILVRMAHISEKTKMLAEEIDKMYDVLGDAEFLDMLKKDSEK